MTTFIAHISDLHLNDSERSRERAARVVTYLARMRRRPDALVVTGDIADNGRPDEYATAAALFADLFPRDTAVLTCPGNHDDRENYRRALVDGVDGVGGNAATHDGSVNQCRMVAGLRFFMCDSTVPGQAGGHLGDETLGWLDAELAKDGATPAIVCFHHPPALLHSPFIDAIRQTGEERLANVVRRHSCVVAVLCGHAHTACATTFAGKPLVVAPGVNSTLLLPWEHGEQWSHDDVLDRTAPPGLAFHVIDDAHAITTHFRVAP